MELKKYIKTIFKPAVAKRAKAMKRAKRERGMSAEMSRRAKIAALEKSLGYVFRDKSILREALTHPGSVGFERKIKSNQRLEFLATPFCRRLSPTPFSESSKMRTRASLRK